MSRSFVMLCLTTTHQEASYMAEDLPPMADSQDSGERRLKALGELPGSLVS